MNRPVPVRIVSETRTFYLSNGYSVRFEPPSIEDRKAFAKSRATLYNPHGKMVDYLLEAFSVRDTKYCRKLAVDIYECFCGKRGD